MNTYFFDRNRMYRNENLMCVGDFIDGQMSAPEENNFLHVKLFKCKRKEPTKHICKSFSFPTHMIII